MVDPSMPWSLKGISDEAREFAKQSADESQTPVGAWLSAVIRSAAAHEKASDAAPVPAPDPEPPVAPAHQPAAAAAGAESRPTGSTIERAAQIVDDFGFEPEGPARDADLIDDPARLRAELIALERRLEDSKANTHENPAPLIEKIERVRSRLNALGKH